MIKDVVVVVAVMVVNVELENLDVVVVIILGAAVVDNKAVLKSDFVDL